MKLIKIIVLACFLGIISFTVTAKTQDIPEDWKTECVGYFQVSIPGEADIGIARGGPDPSKLSQALNVGDHDLFADSIYLEGLIRTSSILPEASFLRIKTERSKSAKISRGDVAGYTSIKDTDYVVKKTP